MKNLIIKDWRILTNSFVSYLLLIIVSFLVGSSFSTSLMLYSNASMSALEDPLYAKEFDPFLGIFVPTIGGIYLLFTLILPFAAVFLLSDEFEKNTIEILFNFYNKWQILFSKFIVMFGYIIIVMLITLPSVLWFVFIGGHFSWIEYLLIMFGYILYGSLVASISFFMTSCCKNKSVSTMMTVGILILPWIIDFFSDFFNTKFLDLLSVISFTSLLKPFEDGIVSLQSIVFLIVIIGAVLLISIFMVEYYDRFRWYKSLVVVVIIFAFSVFFRYEKEIDITESKRNSFPSSVSSVLKNIKNLEIEIHLNKYDSRFIDYNNEFLKRLLVVNPYVKVKYKEDENYGILVYRRYSGKGVVADTTYSNSKEEALDIIASLYGVKILYKDDYKGYPMVVSSEKIKYANIVYYFLLPTLFMGFYLKRRLL